MNKIISFAELDGDETVLEIGAGPGILTFPLAEHAGRVIAIELEPAFAGYLEKEARKRGLDNLTVIRGDALSVELPAFDTVVSNLPYSISSPVTFRLLPLDFKLGILMYQKEFAQRLIASPGTKQRGVPTLKAGYYAEILPLLEVSRTDFYPVPQVDSMVLEFRKRPFPFHLHEREFYFKLIDVLFMHRRRKIRNSLLMGYMNLPGTRGMGKELMKGIIESHISNDFLDRRPEDLSDQEAVELTNALRVSVETIGSQK